MKIFILIALALTVIGTLVGTVYFVLKELKKGL